MSEHIPWWVFGLFGLGSPVQALLNRWIPERIRPLILWAVAAGIVVAAVLATPLDWGDCHVQLALVYAALTSGWAMSKVIAPPVRIGTAVAKALMVLVPLVGLGFALTGIARAQFDSLVVIEPAAPEREAIVNIAGFIWAQVAAFIGASLTRWLGKKRPGSLRNK
jgi:hypothetical protein